jgi:hypothetical protein
MIAYNCRGSLVKAFIIAMICSLVFASSTCRAQESALQNSELFTVTLEVGQILKICETDEVICPVVVPRCDDLDIVNVVDTPDGVGFFGVSAGATTCSVFSGTEDGKGIGTHIVFKAIVE